MTNATISDGQSLLDVALQELGSIAALFDLADANGLGITDALAAGQVLAVPASAAARPELAGYFAARQVRINTGDVVVPPPAVAAQRYFSNLFFTPSFYA